MSNSAIMLDEVSYPQKAYVMEQVSECTNVQEKDKSTFVIFRPVKGQIRFMMKVRMLGGCAIAVAMEAALIILHLENITTNPLNIVMKFEIITEVSGHLEINHQ